MDLARVALESDIAKLPLSRWDELEVSLAPGSAIVLPGERAAVLKLPFDLLYRRLYVYREIVTSGAAEVIFRARLAFRRMGQIMAEVPLAETTVANGSALVDRSCATIATINTSPTGQDSVELSLSSRMTGTARQVLLTPCRLVTVADEVTLDVLSVLTDAGSVTNYRAWLGILSSSVPQ